LGRDAACALCKKCKFKVLMNKGLLTTNLWVQLGVFLD
jgi:hypothetical protein